MKSTEYRVFQQNGELVAMAAVWEMEDDTILVHHYPAGRHSRTDTYAAGDEYRAHDDARAAAQQYLAAAVDSSAAYHPGEDRAEIEACFELSVSRCDEDDAPAGEGGVPR